MTRLFLALLFAVQTVIPTPDNKYSPAEDVKMGREAADQVERQLPVMRDDEVTSYVEGVGRRLVDAIPEALRHSEFHYTFKVVNVREINAFALPGGPMFVNRGCSRRPRTKEVAGVMAHEISHVVLRHGTAQASKATKYQAGAVAGTILGAILGGGLGRVVAETTRFGVGAAFLKFGRDFERQADLEGAQIMARAGYDPHDMANFFKTIQQQGGSNGPEWLSDHPDPGNRYETILREAQSLRVENPVTDPRPFDQLQTHLKRLPRAPTTAEASRSASARATGPAGGGTPPSGRVEPPSDRYTQYRGSLFRVSAPSNWRELRGSNSITFAPPGAFGTINGQSVFTHGVEIGISRNQDINLRAATDDLIGLLSRGNAEMHRSADNADMTFAGRGGLRTTLSNRSEATGQPETIEVFTTLLRDRSLFYLIAVAPADSYRDYVSTFDRIVDSLRLSE
jgi:hypothetical protein